MNLMHSHVVLVLCYGPVLKSRPDQYVYETEALSSVNQLKTEAQTPGGHIIHQVI